MAQSTLIPKKRTASGRRTRKSDVKTVPATGHLSKDDTAFAGLTNHCFGCAPGNRHGLHLRFQKNIEAGGVECVFRVPHRFEGPPGHVHGGIIATILDEAMGKVNRQKEVVALTRRMSIDYLQPVPLGVKLRAVGWPVKQDGRKHFRAGEIHMLDGVVLARSEGMFIAIDPVEIFRKHREKTGRNDRLKNKTHVSKSRHRAPGSSNRHKEDAEPELVNL
jgi:uncharacterized protein (TIGR00369 family)